MRFAIPIFLAFVGPLAAQPPDFGTPVDPKSFDDIATVETSIDPKAAKPGEVVTLKFTIFLKAFCHTYPILPKQASNNKIITPKGPLIDVGGPIDPQGFHVKAGENLRYYDDKVTWEWKAVVSPKAEPGKKKIAFDDTRLLACIEMPPLESCFPADKRNIPAVDMEVLAGPALPVPSDYQAIVDKALGGATVTPLVPDDPKEKPHAGLIRKNAQPSADYQADLDAIRTAIVQDSATANAESRNLAALLAAALFWGFVSLVTPCVFPMIPITVSLFLKQSHQSTAGAMKFAAMYCLTIIVVLGLAAVFLLNVFSELAVSPGMNILLGLLLGFFAFSLFGMYDIQLPGFLLRATERRRAAGGLIGTVFGALAFSIVSFTCVAPFLGGFAGLAASGNYGTFELILAGLTFAAAFASPFFVLAMFPSMLKKLPKSGGWLDTVKAVMGFLELAAALKFLRAAEIRRPPVEYFTFDVVLAAWVAIFLACGLYLLGVFRLPHDEEKPNLGVFRMFFALCFLGFSIYLMPGLLKTADGKAQRPGGVAFAWVEAFLLPELNDDIPWSFDLKAAFDESRKQKKLVFVDFTGVNCTNCRYNENYVFPVPAIREAMSKLKLVQLYTDDMPLEAYNTPPDAAIRESEAALNKRLQRDYFGDTRLPLYAIFEPLADGKVKLVGVYPESKINNKEAFLKFLTRQ